MKSPITNGYDRRIKRPHLQVEISHIFVPRCAADWTYAHHPHIVYFKNRLYAIWSSGRVHEDDLGQRVMISSSEDFHHWTEPKALVGSLQGKHSELVLTAAGFYPNDDSLVAYFGQYEYQSEQIVSGVRKMEDKGHMDTCLRAVTTSDGECWSDPVDLDLPIVPNHGPARTSTGRLIISGNMMFPYSDDMSGTGGWRKSGIYDPALESEVWDDSEALWRVKEHMGWPTVLCEGSWYETDDGRIRMLLRSNTEHLWVTESIDDGATWTSPKETLFTDNASKFHVGRLSDGRYYYVGCPDPQPRWKRNPLVLSLSEDGIRFDRHFILGNESFTAKFPGSYKGGDYGYPHSLVHDGYLYVVFSICKERIAVMRTAIETI
ncbi:exo-alpha-sialidase [Paenibacillus sp. J5C_2022]|uniref:exo-alpha-sialidase n=1 Tax=Paenibacillus sp. J5C2022 TaxID=2977129 RepID=UPI0021CE680B|nr:exo-alpha-sialidase [Paenibacillus sp. J5C2022]MCU6711461.1 exo-alpha-sialidase [Paenibacillus sp. J5C2022]